MTDDGMRRSRRILLRSVALGVVGGLAGCVGFGDSGRNEPGSEAPTSSPATTSTTASPSPTPTTTSPSPTTSTEPWTPPESPKQPTEDKREDRITDAEFINTVKAQTGDSYTNFDLRIGANTWLKNVDPPKDEDGEPFFIVEINGTLVARTDIVPFRKQGSFTIPIKQAALDQFDSGTLTITVSLFDEDHSRADLYDSWTGTIEYNSK